VSKTKEQKFVYLFHFSIKPTVQLTKSMFGEAPKVLAKYSEEGLGLVLDFKIFKICKIF